MGGASACSLRPFYGFLLLLFSFDAFACLIPHRLPQHLRNIHHRHWLASRSRLAGFHSILHHRHAEGTTDRYDIRARLKGLLRALTIHPLIWGFIHKAQAPSTAATKAFLTTL